MKKKMNKEAQKKTNVFLLFFFYISGHSFLRAAEQEYLNVFYKCIFKKTHFIVRNMLEENCDQSYVSLCCHDIKTTNQTSKIMKTVKLQTRTSKSPHPLLS